MERVETREREERPVAVLSVVAEATRPMLRAMLAEAGFELRDAYSVVQAERALERRPGRACLVLSSALLLLEEYDGYRRLLERWPGLPVVAIGSELRSPGTWEPFASGRIFLLADLGDPNGLADTLRPLRTWLEARGEEATTAVREGRAAA